MKRRDLWTIPAAFVVLSSFLASTARADLTSCIAASEQALSLRRAGKLHDARRQLAACSAPACPEELRVECSKRMDGVNAAMPGLVVRAKDSVGDDLLKADVSVDGARVATLLDGRPYEVDPGEHLVRVTVQGSPPVERKIVLGEGEKTRNETFVVGPVPVKPAEAASRPSSESTGWGTPRTLAVVSGSVGLAGIGVGAVFGALASSEWSNAKTAVSSQASCTTSSCAAHATAVNDHDTAETYAAVSTVALGVGAALVVTGVVTWLTAPHRPTRETAASRARMLPGVIPGGGALTVVGAF